MSDKYFDWWVDDDCCVARGAGDDYETITQVAVLNGDGSVDVDTSFEFAHLMAAAPRMRRLLVQAERFLSGFEEDDETQDEPVDLLLGEIRRVIRETGGQDASTD